ncbi:unnamed protein product [Brassica rapa subsp. trilocularis]
MFLTLMSVLSPHRLRMLVLMALLRTMVKGELLRVLWRESSNQRVKMLSTSRRKVLMGLMEVRVSRCSLKWLELQQKGLKGSLKQWRRMMVFWKRGFEEVLTKQRVWGLTPNHLEKNDLMKVITVRDLGS